MKLNCNKFTQVKERMVQHEKLKEEEYNTRLEENDVDYTRIIEEHILLDWRQLKNKKTSRT